ncbi:MULTISPECIES: DUF2752 domain-containing protein [unclassified Solwaraspora]|uniref:DUF2752 domain-containing protein n=1 Tax=unclassified Solwaraspora TaxID=2627926 RepID=UPI00259BA8BE|nr:DUF2752 domain-containing protein [Solwaraspora sp. WMMA2056]WJK39911.1 DUF2752 domain-containing protein [Solwaraspora sp. WMMA2056]
MAGQDGTAASAAAVDEQPTPPSTGPTPSTDPTPPGYADPHGHHAPPPHAHPHGYAQPYPDGYGYPPQPQPDRLTRWVNNVWARSPRWLAPLAVLGCIGAAAGYTVLTDPATSTAEAAPTCLLKLTTGLDCPGCGGTRAVWYLLNGDLGAAARHHVLLVFAIPFLLYVYVAWAGQHMGRWRLPQLAMTPKVIGWFLGAWLAFSVLRNLPWPPFTWFYV